MLLPLLIGLWAGSGAPTAMAGESSTVTPVKHVNFLKLPKTVLPPLTIYTKDNVPPTPTLASLEKRRSITQFGITWTFDAEVPVAQFVTGDWYVVGPVTVVMIDPKPEFGDGVSEPEFNKDSIQETKYAGKRARHGSMLNSPRITSHLSAFKSGFDSRQHVGRYNPALFAQLPIAIKPGDALISTISRRNDEITQFGGQHIDPIRACAVLSCLAEPQPADAFRPSYCDSANSRIYLTRNLRRDVLLRLPRIAGTPDSLGEQAARYQRPWQDICDFSMSNPLENMPHYGQTINEILGEATLLLQMDYRPEEKERLIVNMVQVGLDFWGQMRNGYSWIANGGINQGRKWPIIFAGIMLQDDTLIACKQAYPKCRFEEDDQTAFCPFTYKGKVYEQSWTGAKVFYVGHGPAETTADEGKVGEWDRGWGPLELFHPKDWPLPGKPVLGSDGYRMANSSPAWVGLALAIRLMHMEKAWGNDAFFAYVDRWMTEDDTIQVQALKEHGRIDRTKAKFGEYGRQGYINYKVDLVQTMWKTYRNNLPPGPNGEKTPPAETTWK